MRRYNESRKLFTPRTEASTVARPNVDGSMNFDYSTFEAYLDECSELKRQHSLTLDETWAGGTLKSAIELARHGWPEGQKHMSRFSANITDKVKASLPHQTMFWDTCGLDFDMGMAINGEPECWYDFAPKDEMKFVRIGVNGFFSAAASENVITMRGGAICAIVDALESINYRVELDWLMAAVDMNSYASRVRIKSFNDALDIDRLAFVVTNKAAFRCLSLSHAANKCGRDDSWHCQSKHEWFNGYDIYFPPVWTSDATWLNFQSAENHILDLLRKQGVDIQTKVQGD